MVIDLFLLINTAAKARQAEVATQNRRYMMESRLAEFMLEARRRKPMTPEQMARFYGLERAA